MTACPIEHLGLTIPRFFYGTAWKEDQTERLTSEALSAGFLGIDTANQRRHYDEASVGRAIRKAIAENRVQRHDLFLQTKFTYAGSQDHRIPYDIDKDYGTQVRQSFESSLDHLGTSYLDAYLLHGPSSNQGLTEADYTVWQAMEQLYRDGSVKWLGISNVNIDQLRLLIETTEIKPAFVQNRCYATTRWDFNIRELCRQHGIIYQGFSLLTANSRLLKSRDMTAIAQQHRCSTEQLVFRFALQSGMIPLTGTSSKIHMQEDLATDAIALSDTDMATIENLACQP
jgi:diketogulonate reductase-like aldo/keto reductase